MAEHEIAGNEEMVNTILLYRICDLLSVILSNINSQDWEAVMKAHEEGLFVTPLPAISTQLEDEDA